MVPTPTWQPRRFIRQESEPFDTSTGTALWKTDATFGFVKALGNGEGEHTLACEFVASSLAAWFGLPVPDFALLTLPEELCYPLPRGAVTKPGPTFVSRKVTGRTWGGSAEELTDLVNLEAVTWLVVFDTWVRNRDRYLIPNASAEPRANYENVFLAEADEPNRYRLYAIDHTHCFDDVSEFTRRLADTGRVRDDRTFGLFPAFGPRIRPASLHDCRAKLLTLQTAEVEAIIDLIPSEWQVNAKQRADLADLILHRASYIADRIEQGWRPVNPPAPEPQP